MNEVFGLETSILAGILAGILALAVAAVGFIALTSRTMFRMGVRNIPRRRAQTGLIIAGLTLSTLVVTAAFATGDTINHSFTKSSYDVLQRTDLAISFNGARELGDEHGVAIDGEQASVDVAVVAVLEEAFRDDPLIAGFNPLRFERVAAMNGRTRDAVASVQLAGFDPARLEALGGLRLSAGGAANLRLSEREVLVSERANRDLHLAPGDTLNLYVDGAPSPFRVAGIVEDELASGVLGYSYAELPGGIAMTLTAMESLLGGPGTVNWISVMLAGGVRDTVGASPDAAAGLEAYLAAEGASAFVETGGLDLGRPITVEQLKLDAIENGQQTGELFITIFLALGLFAIAAGALLVFMIFVMLAAERKAEMGMIRAVGARRRQLVQAFVAEGMTYALVAGIPGVILGVFASLALTVGLLKLTGGDEFALISPQVTLKSIAIGYCLGAALTFGTVLFSSLKVSHVNIVAAIRGTDDQAPAGRSRTIRARWIALGIVALPVLPLGLDWLFHRGLGVRRALIWAPLGIAAALGLVFVGKSGGQLFFFATGISIIPLCLAALAAALRAPARPAWSSGAVALLAYWSLPTALHERLFGTFSSDIEMFLVSGLMMVVASTLLIVFNAPVLTRLVQTKARARYRLTAALLAGAAGATVIAGAAGDAADGAGQLLFLAAILLIAAAALAWAAARFGSLAPALKMAVAYPLANRFRTGMTLAMFSLVVFSITALSILMANFSSLEGGESARGNLDVVLTSTTSPLPGDLVTWLEASSVDVSGVAGSGRVTLARPNQLVRNAGGEEWIALPVRGADPSFFTSLLPSLDARAEGFATDGDVLAAVAANPRFALLDRASLRGDWSEFGYDAGIAVTSDDTFTPFDIEVLDETTGRTATVTVIGALGSRLPTPSFAGVYLNADAFRATFGEPEFRQAYLSLSAGSSEDLARAICAAVAVSGVDAGSVAAILDREQAEQRTFNRMFQAFMALGLFVGIAGLGVIAMRSVVERRQQIGMLRAIGFQRTTITLTFLLESAFVAVMGIIAGISGGTIIGRNVLTSEAMVGSGNTTAFAVPWAEIGLLALIALAFALAMTWWPSRNASRVPVAEALRYE